MKALRLLMMVAILAAGFAFMPARSATNAQDDCINLAGNGDTDVFAGPYSLTAGTTIMITMTTGDPLIAPEFALQQVPSAGTLIQIAVDGNLEVNSVQYMTPHTISYTMTTNSSNVLFHLDWEFNGLPENSYTIDVGCNLGCAPYIPEQAVGGQFISNAEIFWMPGEMVNPPVVIEAGKTYLVAGQDATGMYRKVLVACDWVWVRAETVGPNFDDVWNGTPLPTTVVE